MAKVGRRKRLGQVERRATEPGGEADRIDLRLVADPVGGVEAPAERTFAKVARKG
jgi:hypothetical protein